MAGLAGLGALGGLPVALRARSLPLRLPSGSMRLERRLIRELGGGAAITVRRCWDITFTPQTQGVLVAGRQTAATVEAPARLAALARIEERRDTGGMFPLLLSDKGTIIGAGAAPVAPADLAAALQTAEHLVAAARLEPAERRERIMRHLAEMQRAGAGQFDMLPGDLLFPLGTPVRHVESLALPGDLAGEFALTWEARAVPGGDWLAEGRRQIVTRIGAHERRSQELWSLAAA